MKLTINPKIKTDWMAELAKTHDAFVKDKDKYYLRFDEIRINDQGLASIQFYWRDTLTYTWNGTRLPCVDGRMLAWLEST